LALRAVFIAVISGRFTVRTIFPIGTVRGTCVSAVAAFTGVVFTTTTVCQFTVVTCAAALGAMRNGEISLQHVDMIRPRLGINQSPDDAAREKLNSFLNCVEDVRILVDCSGS
jgi:hypothetical protein